MRLSVPIQLKAAPDAEGLFEGVISPFGGEPDAYGDVIAAGAFKTTLARHAAKGTMPALLWQHDQKEPIGVWRELEETAMGLWGVGKLTLATKRGGDAHALMRDGALGLSIGYAATSARQSDSGTRVLTEIDLIEVSAVSIPANHRARVVAVKAALCASRASFEHAQRHAFGLSAREAKRVAALGWRGLSGTNSDDTPDTDELARHLTLLNKQLRRPWR